jgi:hypothetical protein
MMFSIWIKKMGTENPILANGNNDH